MRPALRNLALAALLYLPGAAMAQSAETFRRVGESLVKIEAGNNAASGFVWSDKAHAVTSLHVVDGKASITAHYVGADGKIIASSVAIVERVLKESDLVLLRLQTPQERRPLVASPNAPAVKQSLDALGFPLNIASYSNTEVKVRFGGQQLRTILPAKVLRQITDYPSTSVEILNLEGNLVPGLSGAPIIDASGNVVGIVDGGLEEGAIGISWGIPASHLQRLARSTVTRVPGAPRLAELFAADLQADVRPAKNIGSGGWTKLRSRTFAQLAGSADDQLGLVQLATLFQAFNPYAFRYDVYQDLGSGATVVVPEGATISTQGGLSVVTTGDRRMSMKIRLKGGINSGTELQTQALAFEQQLVGGGPGVIMMPDPSWTYLQPMSAFGVTIHRKAFSRASYQGGQLLPEKYYFELLAAKGNKLLGVAAVNNDSSMATMNLEALCGQGVFNARCPALVRSRAVWAQMVLGVQFSTFPRGQF